MIVYNPNTDDYFRDEAGEVMEFDTVEEAKQAVENSIEDTAIGVEWEDEDEHMPHELAFTPYLH